MVILLFLACSSGKVDLDSGEVDEVGEGESEDTAEDSGMDSAALVTYAGTVAGAVSTTAFGLVTCNGEFSLAWAGDLQVSGEARCEGDNGVFAGPVTGEVSGAKLSGVFAYTGYGYTGEAEVDADLGSDLLSGEVADQDDGIAMSLVLDGAVQ